LPVKLMYSHPYSLGILIEWKQVWRKIVLKSHINPYSLGILIEWKQVGVPSAHPRQRIPTR